MKFVDMIVESEDSKDSLARLVFFAHGFNARPGASRIAISFPDFSEAVVNEFDKIVSYPTPGAKLRLFGEALSLREFIDSPSVARCLRLGIARASEIQEIPEGALSERFVRDRKLQKTYKDNAYARRQQLRAVEQGRQYFAKKKTIEPSVRLEMRSKANGSEFLLDIRREPCPDATSWFVEINAYGLSSSLSATPRF